MKKRTSKIWSISKDDLSQEIQESNSLYSVLKFFGLGTKSYYYRTLKKRLSEDGIDYSHIRMGSDCNLGKKMGSPKNKISLENILVKGSRYNRSHLKARLILNKMLENRCSICCLGPEWNNKPLVMVLDHINGDGEDNRLPNLRLLCPNCNSQQPTFSGRNNKRAKAKKAIKY